MSQLIRDYIETVWNQGRTEEAERFLADDLVQHNPHLPNGRRPLVEFIDGLRQQLPGLHFDIRRTAAEGDLVFAHSLFTAEPGARGSAVIDVFRIADGLIAEHWDVREDVPESTTSGNPVA